MFPSPSHPVSGTIAVMAVQTRRILVIETSSRWGSTALATEEGIVESVTLPGNMRHAGELLPTVERLMRGQDWSPADLTDVFVSIGPGSFTGLRIAVTVARTLAWVVGVRVVAVPTVDVLALNAVDANLSAEHVAVVLDAKQSQVFGALFNIRDERVRKLIDAHMIEPETFLRGCPRPLAVLGEGVTRHRQAIEVAGVTILDEMCWRPRAPHVYRVGMELAQAGRIVRGGDLLPLYLRRPEAEEKWERLHGPEGRKRF